MVLRVSVGLFGFKQKKGETGLGYEQFEIIYSVAQEKCGSTLESIPYVFIKNNEK